LNSALLDIRLERKCVEIYFYAYFISPTGFKRSTAVWNELTTRKVGKNNAFLVTSNALTNRNGMVFNPYI